MARAFCDSGEVGVEMGGLGSCVGVNGSLLGARCGWRSGELGSPREPWLGRWECGVAALLSGAAALAVLGDGVGHRREEWEARACAHMRRELTGGVRV